MMSFDCLSAFGCISTGGKGDGLQYVWVAQLRLGLDDAMRIAPCTT
jgi:hypothetical protein